MAHVDVNYMFNAGKAGFLSGSAGANFVKWNASPSATFGYRVLFLVNSANALLNPDGVEDAATIGDITGLIDASSTYEHATVTGYVMGGFLLANRVVTISTSLDRVENTANNIVIASLAAGGTITDLLLYYENGQTIPGANAAATAAAVNLAVPIARYYVGGSTNNVGTGAQFSIKWPPNTTTFGRVFIGS